MPLLEDLPVEEKVRRGNVLHQVAAARRRGNAAAADQRRRPGRRGGARSTSSAQQQMWSLADDIEHVLAHRDVRDWYVFEAASWALAEQRMPAERRRELWLEPLPAAELAGRLRDAAALRVGHRRRAVPHRRRRAAGPARAGQRPAEGRGGPGEPAPAARRDGRGAAPADAERRTDRAAGRARVQRGAPGPADARDDAHRAGRRHAGAVGRRAAHAAGRQHRPRDRAVRHAVGAGCRQPGAGPADVRRRRSSPRSPRRADADREGARAAEGAALQPHLGRGNAAGRGGRPRP